MPSIIAQKLIEIWRQLLRGVQQDIWYALITTDDFGCNLQAATNLTEGEYDTLLISSGIIFKKGNTTMIRKAKRDYLQTALKENITLHITRSQLPGNNKRTFYFAVGYPLLNPLQEDFIGLLNKFQLMFGISSHHSYIMFVVYK